MHFKIKKYTILFLLIILLLLSFTKNIFGKNFIQNPIFEGFQSDSEYLVFSKVFQDKYSIDGSKYGLACVTNEENARVDNIWDVIYHNGENIKVGEYPSQLGLQGYIFSFLYNKINMPFWIMKLICCIVLAIIVIRISYIIYHKYGKLMGAVFYITFLLSPWVISFARNLYWVEFTWFLPILIALKLSTNYQKRKIFVPCIFLAILIKCLCGYEYISTIMMGTVSFFIVDFFLEKDRKKRKIIFKTTIEVGIACICAFVVAMCMHASLRGNGNILYGIENIYKNDILRRTIIVSNDVVFPEVYQESLNAGIISTISKYFVWNSNILLGIEGKYFMIMFISTIAIIAYNILRKRKNCYRDMVMYIMFLVTTLSWIILGKSHSYIHTHINFVLWYFGFIQICLYEIIQFICQVTYEIGEKIVKEEKNI